jgi:hypothetical protein
MSEYQCSYYTFDSNRWVDDYIIYTTKEDVIRRAAELYENLGVSKFIYPIQILMKVGTVEPPPPPKKPKFKIGKVTWMIQ